MPFLTVTISDVISVLALGVSVYAIWQTRNSNKKQESLRKSQEELNNRLLEKENEDVLKAKKAELGASFVRQGQSQYRLEIHNKGHATAKNVRIEFPEPHSVGLIMDDELKAKFPMQSLERHQSVDLRAIVHMETKRKHTVKLIWDDDVQINNEHLCYATI
jgi:hypothetical protein